MYVYHVAGSFIIDVSMNSKMKVPCLLQLHLSNVLLVNVFCQMVNPAYYGLEHKGSEIVSSYLSR